MKDRIKKQHTGNLRKEYSRTRKTGFLLMGTILLLAGCVKDDLIRNTPTREHLW